MSTKVLPAGWSSILDEVHARLDQAIASTNARLESLPQANLESIAHARRQEITQWSERLTRVSAFLESAEQIVQSVDELLGREETQIKQQLALCETLRQKAG